MDNQSSHVDVPEIPFDPKDYGVNMDVLNSLIGLAFECTRRSEESIYGLEEAECKIIDFCQDGIIVRFFDETENSLAYFTDILRIVNDATIKSAIHQFEQAAELHKRLCDITEYDIYLLKDSRNNMVRYVGISRNVALRYIQHTRHHSKNIQKDLWISDLESEGLLPILEIIEHVIGRYQALKREAYWLNFYNKMYPLLNIDLNVTYLHIAKDDEVEG